MLAKMNDGLDFQAKALVLRAERQRVIASNIANADTPGFAARDIDFKQAMSEATGRGRLAPTGTRHAGHIPLTGGTGGVGGTPNLAYVVQTQPSMDGNSVDLDRERANFVDNSVRYESTLRFINIQSKTLLSAIQGQ